MLVVIDIAMAAPTNVGSDLVYRIGFSYTNWSLVVCSDSGPNEANFLIVALVTAK